MPHGSSSPPSTLRSGIEAVLLDLRSKRSAPRAFRAGISRSASVFPTLVGTSSNCGVIGECGSTRVLDADRADSPIRALCTPVEEVRITEGRVTPMQLAVVPNQIELLPLLKANYGFHDSA